MDCIIVALKSIDHMCKGFQKITNLNLTCPPLKKITCQERQATGCHCQINLGALALDNRDKWIYTVSSDQAMRNSIFWRKTAENNVIKQSYYTEVWRKFSSVDEKQSIAIIAQDEEENFVIPSTSAIYVKAWIIGHEINIVNQILSDIRHCI